jgi:hypothetical protein
MEPGFTATGYPFDLVVTELHGEHVAIVTKGRAGPSCAISHKELRA